MWIKLLKDGPGDAEWDLGNICFTLTNRRHGEKSITCVNVFSSLSHPTPLIDGLTERENHQVCGVTRSSTCWG